MNTREQFGKYLLLKKLTEDPLGETFRAGLVGSVGMDRVALLRIFNGQGLDGTRLWQGAKDRRAIQDALKSPNIGEGIDMGEIQGIPYVAYDYVSGKNMATLLEQAARKRNYIPADHALLITERVALALAAACENRLGGQRILHGFLIPQLTMISNEGETRLLGFEVAPALRGFAANPVIRQHFGRYLAPEALAGAPPDRADDIYSLGVFLFELMTGRPLPPPAPDGYTSVIDQGLGATTQEPLPEELRQLLKKSLVAREHRMNDVVAWHKTLNTWMFEGQHNPTTFNLAFFMHNLFRQEIELESQEIEVEKTLPLPVQKPAPAAATAAVPAAAAPAPAAPVQEITKVHAEKTEDFIPEYAKEEPKSKKGLILVIAAVAVLVLAALGYYFWSGSRAATPPPVVAAPPPPPALPPEPEGPTQEELEKQAELENQIKELIDKQAGAIEEQLRGQYEKQLKDLERELDVRKKAADRRQQELERQRAEEEAAALLAEEQKAEEEAAAEAAATAALEEKAKEEEEAEPVEVAEAEPPPPPPAVVAPPPPPPPPPARPQVRRGDLVEMGPGVTPPSAVRLTPRFPEMARRLRKAGATVTVKALIDENGKVLKADLVGDKVGFGFDNEALQAVKKATFRPATKGGVPVKLWFKLNVKFQQP